MKAHQFAMKAHQFAKRGNSEGKLTIFIFILVNKHLKTITFNVS